MRREALRAMVLILALLLMLVMVMTRGNVDPKLFILAVGLVLAGAIALETDE